MSESKLNGYACPRCTVGRCTPGTTTFAEMVQGHLMTVPNVRTYVCDVCHFSEYEQDTLEALWHELYGEDHIDDFQSVASQKRSSTFGGESN